MPEGAMGYGSNPGGGNYKASDLKQATEGGPKTGNQTLNQPAPAMGMPITTEEFNIPKTSGGNANKDIS